MHHISTSASKKNVFERNSKMTLLVFILLTLGVFTLAADKFIGYLDDQTSTYIEKEGLKRYIRMREQAPNKIKYLYPGEEDMKGALGLTQKQYKVRVDKDGFILPSRVHENPDFKIFFLGGSTTECVYMEEEYRFPYLVGRLLESQGRKINSYNGGVGGNNSMHSINILLNKVIPMHPDIVVLMHNINDLSVLMYERTYWNKNPTRRVVGISPKLGAIDHFRLGAKSVVIEIYPHLYQKMRNFRNMMTGRSDVDEWSHVRGRSIEVNERLIKEQFKKSMETFISISNAQSFIPVLMTQARRKPLSVAKEESSIWSMRNRLFDEFNEIIRKVGETNNVLVIDLNKIIGKEEKYLYDSIHYTKKGSMFVAKNIAQQIERLLSVIHRVNIN